MDAFNDELNSFKARVKQRAKERLAKAMAEVEEVCSVLYQRQIQDFPKGGAWVVAGMDSSYLDFL